MKKIFSILFIVYFSYFAYSREVIDLIKTKKPYYTWASILEINYFSPIGYYKDCLEPAPYLNFKMRFNPRLTDYFLTDLEIGYAFSRVNDYEKTKYSFIPVGVSANYFYPLIGHDFFIGASAGGGFYYMKIGEDDFKNFYFKSGIGLKYKVTGNLLLNINGNFLYLYDVEEPLKGFSTNVSFTYAFGTPLTDKDVKILTFHSDKIFPALYPKYYNDKIGILRLKNTTGKFLKDVRVSLYI